jgi:hypothetical protein
MFNTAFVLKFAEFFHQERSNVANDGKTDEEILDEYLELIGAKKEEQNFDSLFPGPTKM